MYFCFFKFFLSKKSEIIEHSDDPYSKVSYLKLQEIVLIDKN